ncbi:MAG: nucleotidyl transferase AbiEii/AbiGii toxin family protein [Chloroflexi bacterium]|nr:nucleotidyl transferase AbiEii/AbiGii toxin family protein [Chloroflexota bacterium]
MFQKLLEKIALALEERSIAYMLIGGQALLLYGEPRLTKDIDITLGIGPERLNLILGTVKDLRFDVLVEKPEKFVPKTLVLPCLEPRSGIRVDFIFSYSPYEQKAIKRASHVKIGRANVRFASVEDLIIHKVIAGRPRDLEDVRGVLIKNPAVDVTYIRRWLKQFEKTTSEQLVKRFNEIQKESR